MSYRVFRLQLFPMEPLHFGYGEQRGNVLPSLPYIPGRALRGALGAWAHRNCFLDSGDEAFQKVFGEECVDGACDYDISFPCCYLKDRVPAPLSLFEVKGGGSDPRLRFVKKNSWRLIHTKNLQVYTDPEYLVDFLCRSEWPSEVETWTLQPVKNATIWNGLVYPAHELQVELHAAHEENTGRVGQEGLFAEELLPRSTGLSVETNDAVWYGGQLIFDAANESLSKICEKLTLPEGTRPDVWEEVSPWNIIFLGRRRVPVAVFAKEETVSGAGQDNGSNEVTLTFTTDLKGKGDDNPFPPSADYFKKLLNVEVKEKLRAFAAQGYATGGIHLPGKPFRALPAAPTLRAGSCLRLQLASGSDSLDALKWQGLRGIGADTRDGCGRFEVNAAIHSVEAEAQ